MPAEPRLRQLPGGFAATVASLHRVAERIVAPARKPDNEIALQATPGGFGTPVFDYAGVERQVRVEGAELVHVVGDEVRRAPLKSLSGAGGIVAELLPDCAELDDEALGIDPAAALALGEFYVFADAVLARITAGAGPGDDPSPAYLWPEHFDLAIELGDEGVGLRANYGASPGDESHPEPYLYVGPWTAEVSGELWRAKGFSGAELSYADLVAAPDQEGAALDFFETRKDALAESTGPKSEETK